MIGRALLVLTTLSLLGGCATVRTLDAAKPGAPIIYSGTRLDWYSLNGGCCPLERFGALAPKHAALDLPASALLDTLNQDYIRTARAKGLSLNQAVWRHALRNALIPVLTILGLQFPFLLAGGIIIENVFALPGLGRLVFQAITQRDLIVVQGVVVVLVFAVVLVSFLIDLAYVLVDPRLRERRG